LSIFEPHTALIVRGKARTPAEFGHKVFLAESGTGLITDDQILDGNPADEDHVAPSLERHQRLFGAAPILYAGDRGFYTPANAATVTAAGVPTECLPQRGGHKTPARAAHETTRAFKQGQRFRAGIEGRISVLFRGRGMKRCLLTGRARFEVFVGLAILANNLLRIAELLTHPARRRRRRPPCSPAVPRPRGAPPPCGALSPGGTLTGPPPSAHAHSPPFATLTTSWRRAEGRRKSARRPGFRRFETETS
jgi:IS5 family transposase